MSERVVIDAVEYDRRRARRRAQIDEVLAAIRPARLRWQQLARLREGNVLSNRRIDEIDDDHILSRIRTRRMLRGEHPVDEHPMQQRIIELRALAIHNRRMIRLETGQNATEMNNATALRSDLCPVMNAASSGDVERLRQLLRNRSWLRIKGDRGQTPLHEAACNGHVEVVRLLIQMCSGIEKVPDSDNLSSLHYAAEYGHADVVLLLLTHGIEVDAKSRFQTTALHKASRSGHLEIVQILLHHGANIDLVDNKKRTPLHKACLKGRSDVAAYLIQQGAEVDAKTTSGQTALCKALKGRHGTTVQVLLENGAKIQEEDKEHGSLLFRAVATDFLDALFLIVRMNPQYWISIQHQFV